MRQLDAFRTARDRFFKEHPQSPLTDAQRGSFAGLRSFPERPELRLAMPVEPFDQAAPASGCFMSLPARELRCDRWPAYAGAT